MAITQPKYAQVADVLRKRILTGVYQPGDMIPSERELREEFDISSPTAKSAKAQLEKEGLVYSQQGRGTFVRESKELIRDTSNRYRPKVGPPNMREEHEGGWKYEVTAERRQVQASPAVAARLEIEPGDMCSEAVYHWYVDGELVMISTQWEPLAITKGTPIELPAGAEPSEDVDVITRFASIGITIDRVREDIRSRMPTPDETYELKIPAGVPVFCIERTHYGRTPVETADILMRADRFVLRNDQAIPCR